MMPENGNRQPPITNQQIMRWYYQLNSRLFLVGGIMRRQGAQGLARAAKQGSTRAVSMLAGAAVNLSDTSTLEIVAGALRQVTSQNAIDAIWRVWQVSRQPLLTAVLLEHNRPAASPFALKVLSALKLKQPQLLTRIDSSLVEPLFAACSDADPEIAATARAALLDLENPSAIDAVCRMWAGTRSEVLEWAVVNAGYMPRRPAPVRVLCALKLDRLSIAQDTDADGARALVSYCNDADPDIAARARRCLSDLKRPEARDAVCRVFNETLNEHARQAALTTGYLPTEALQRAIFFFLTGQWERYASIDFDQRLMRAYYEGASTDIRQNIARSLQASGRSDLLTIIAGTDLRSRTEDLTDNEITVLVEMLATGENWPRLWSLALDLPLAWSLKVIQQLLQQGWQPDSPEEAALFQSLASLATSQPWDGASPEFSIPLAVQRARIRASSRINDVAFSPVDSVVAIGTGNGRAALWDFHKGEMQTVLNGFSHSVARLAYDPSGLLACGERTNGSSTVPSSIYIWNGSKLKAAGSHGEAVTIIEPLGDSRFLTGGRDSDLAQVDGDAAHRTGKIHMPGSWPRYARLSPGGQEVLLYDSAYRTLNINTMNLVEKPAYGEKAYGNRKSSRGVTTAMLFLPDGSLLAGKWNGLVARCQAKNNYFQVDNAPFADHGSKITGLEMMQAPPVVISASADGDIQFTRWEQPTSLGKIHAPGERLTSMRISPDGAFLATGDSDASMTLWDIRSLALAKALQQPMIQASPRILPVINTLLENGSCPEPVQHTLTYFKQVVEFRFRFEIGVADSLTIQAGEFDILVD